MHRRLAAAVGPASARAQRLRASGPDARRSFSATMRTRARPLRGLERGQGSARALWTAGVAHRGGRRSGARNRRASVAALLGAQCARSRQPLCHLRSARTRRRRTPDHGAEVAAQGDSAAAEPGPGEQAAVQRVRPRLPCRALGAQQCAAACRQGRGAAPRHQGLLPLAAFRTRAWAADRARLWLPGGDRPGRADDRGAAPARERRRNPLLRPDRAACLPAGGAQPARGSAMPCW